MEVLHVWQEYNSAVEEVAPGAAGIAWLIKMLRGRWQRDRDEHPAPEKPRPRVFNLYNENDELIQSVIIDLPDGEPVEQEVTRGQIERRMRPKREWEARSG
jgi:hypothetical protein